MIVLLTREIIMVKYVSSTKRFESFPAVMVWHGTRYSLKGSDNRILRAQANPWLSETHGLLTSHVAKVQSPVVSPQ